MRCALLIALVLPALTGCRPADAGARIVDVATTTAQGGWAVNYPKQRKVLFMAGRLWVFYADGSQLWARTTADGLTLSDPVLVRDDAGYGHRCAFAFDGTWLHSACCVATDGADVFYRRGTPGADGSLAWDGPPQTAFDVPDGQSVLYPKVLVDAAGRPWVAFMLFEAGFMQAPQRAWVSRSERSDGTWATAPGFRSRSPTRAPRRTPTRSGSRWRAAASTGCGTPTATAATPAASGAKTRAGRRASPSASAPNGTGCLTRWPSATTSTSATAGARSSFAIAAPTGAGAPSDW